MRNILCLLSILLFSPLFFTFNETVSGIKPIVIIDAGHGGTDGGATGLHGISEKHFNLSTSLKMRDIFLLAGYDVKMTRTTDDDTDGHEGFNKSEDIFARENIGKEFPEAVFLSVHMNFSPASRDKGFQVFYGTKNQQSKVLAEYIHSKMTDGGLATRMREVKRTPDTVYLMNHLQNPCVLLECGFLGNEEDFALLSDEVYREKLSLIFFAATEKYLSESGSKCIDK